MSQATASHFIPTKILLAIDFGAPTYAALEAATGLAQRFHAEINGQQNPIRSRPGRL